MQLSGVAEDGAVVVGGDALIPSGVRSLDVAQPQRSPFDATPRRCLVAPSVLQPPIGRTRTSGGVADEHLCIALDLWSPSLRLTDELRRRLTCIQ